MRRDQVQAQLEAELQAITGSSSATSSRHSGASSNSSRYLPGQPGSHSRKKPSPARVNPSPPCMLLSSSESSSDVDETEWQAFLTRQRQNRQREQDQEELQQRTRLREEQMRRDQVLEAELQAVTGSCSVTSSRHSRQTNARSSRSRADLPSSSRANDNPPPLPSLSVIPDSDDPPLPSLAERLDRPLTSNSFRPRNSEGHFQRSTHRRSAGRTEPEASSRLQG